MGAAMGQVSAAGTLVGHRERASIKHFTVKCIAIGRTSGSALVSVALQAWYPAMCIDNLDPDKPNKFTLLGK